METLAALWGSRWLVYLLVPFLALGGYRVWLWEHDTKVSQAARVEVVDAAKQKADENAALSNDVRNALAAGKRGVRNPYVLRPGQ